MPNESKFEEILETEDLSKYYRSDNCKDQTVRILHEMSTEFSNKQQNYWLKSEDAQKILLAGITKLSLEYQGQLEKEIKFNRNAIEVIKLKLRQLMDSPGNQKLQRIFTPSPQHTAVKFVSAIQIVLQELEQEGNYLVMPSGLLQEKEGRKRCENILKLQKGFHHFLVVVCDDEESAQNLENLFADHHDGNNFGIIISRSEKLDENDEEIKYTDLTEDFQNKILSRIVSLFQEEEKTLTVRDLVGDKPEEVIDFRSIEELLSEEKEIKIPSFNTSTSELYIKRKLRFPFDDQFELGGECRISPDGHIEWFVEKENRQRVWKKIKGEITNRASSTHIIVEDSDLISTGKPVDENQLMNSIENKEKERSVVILSGVAGSGKSTILSSYYKEIKKAKPDHWVIRINLVDHYESILKMGNATRSDAVDFLVNQLHVVDDKSSFSRSLLRNRLETGDRIVFLFDGFDEIDDQCQEKAIQLMKAIIKEKSIPLYVTTRTHVLDKLQLELSQLAYSLEKFTEKDQTDYLVNFWNREINLEEKYDGLLRQFAAFLIEQVSKTLKDKDKSFVGIPLQCRILAECFQSNVKELIETPTSTEHNISRLLVDQKFDLISLYDRLMETKRKIFREEKAKDTNPNQIVKDGSNQLLKEIENHLTKLAIETIVTDQKSTKVLCPPQSSNLSDDDLADEENRITSNGLKFGLTFKSKDDAKAQFLHRTYAEYLFAKYLYKGFLLDDKRHNKLLENESIRQLILEEILVDRSSGRNPKYYGVQGFLNSMLKELVDNEDWRNKIGKRELPDSRLFKRILDYSDADKVIRKHSNRSFPMPPGGFEYSLWNAEEQKETVRQLLKFLNDNREAFDKEITYKLGGPQSIYTGSEENIEPMLTFFIFNENYAEHLNIFLEFLSRSKPYSDDSLFKKLLIKSFCSKEHFISGRIEKALAILCDLKRNQLLIEMRRTVLIIDPEAFQRFYLPEVEAVRAMDLKIWMEPDLYRMTRFHYAAFDGETGTVEEILEKMRQHLVDLEQKEWTDEVMNAVMVEDEFGFTPFYVATARCQKEISNKILAFLKENLPQNKLQDNLIDTKGFLLRPISDAIEFGNIHVFQMILKAVKKEFGQEDLNLVLCQVLPLLGVMAKIVVKKYDKVTDYTDLYDLVFNVHDCDRTSRILECMDAEHIIGMMLLKGVEIFVRDVYDKTNLRYHPDNMWHHEFHTLFRLISCDLLRRFTKDQLEQLGWTKEDLEFEDIGNGWIRLIHIKEREVPRNSYWTDFTALAISDDETGGYNYLSKKILCIFNCMKEKGVSDDVLKKLLLHEEGNGFIMIELSLPVAKRLLTYLSTESQEEVKQQWKNSAPSLETYFPSNVETLNNNRNTNILRFYLVYGSEVHLKDFVNVVTSLHKTINKKGRLESVCIESVWSSIFQHCRKEKKTNEILKLVSEKSDILGGDAVKRMLLHEIDNVPLLFKAVEWGEDIEARLEILPHEIKQEIQQFLEQKAPAFIDQAFQNPQDLFKIFDDYSEYYYKRLNTLIFCLNYSNENQLEKFVHNITIPPFKKFIPTEFLAELGEVQKEQTFGIWGELFTHYCEENFEMENVKKMDEFMKCISEKFGSDAVKELALHNDGEMQVIFYPAFRREKQLLETMLKYLSAEDRKEIQNQVDEFLNSLRFWQG
uniref:NACHT domain-containing protein n=1 Tax=Daphnia galeata TaxID=27404 RepID=A0A8J2RLD9_9CRUS|nr:unnamed protein product [Daphnia galeata]